MATIYNSELSKEIITGAKIATAVDKIPTELAEKVIATMEVNPKIVTSSKIRWNAATTTQTGMNIYVPQANETVYLDSVQISLQSDVICDDIVAACQVTQDGISGLSVAFVRKITLTACQRDVVVTFPKPIKCDQGTAVKLVHTFTAGTTTCGMVITFHSEYI